MINLFLQNILKIYFLIKMTRLDYSMSYNIIMYIINVHRCTYGICTFY